MIWLQKLNNINRYVWQLFIKIVYRPVKCLKRKTEFCELMTIYKVIVTTTKGIYTDFSYLLVLLLKNALVLI